MPGAVQPVLLHPDNFTPTTRTPWGGTRLMAGIKAGLVDVATLHGEPRVGESWEISVSPDFPSRTLDGALLDTLIRADPHAWLGHAAARVASTELLVKLLDAEDDLSVQIHPDDDYDRLEPGQGGKPESWYVVEADPEACLYLGLAPGVDRETLRKALASDDDVSALMLRVPVAPGDFFLLEPGTPHAIGRGCLLVEPQRVTPGKKGVTYRFWDWNRRYDSAGNPSESGTPRSLHVDHALAVTRFEAPRAEEMLARIRRRTGAATLSGPARREPLCGPMGPIVSRHLEVERLSGSGALTVEPGLFHGLTVLDGTVEVRMGDAVIEVVRGCSAALPATVRVELRLDSAHAILSAVP